jgi:putative GTP pyrophosphokinase
MSGEISLTPSQVKKAGRTLRRGLRGDDVDLMAFFHAHDLLLAYRASHQRPLTTANMGLRSVVKTVGCSAVEVSQRLKRVPTILDKLLREPTLPLSSMQDIGGCRAVLGSIEEVRRVEARLKKNRPPLDYSDYITHPRSSGYRGVHLVVEYGGRSIEIQLRTRVMHEWAITVERISGRLGDNLKGDGDHPVQKLLAAISHAMALEEEGRTVDTQLLDEMGRLRQLAAPYLHPRRSP